MDYISYAALVFMHISATTSVQALINVTNANRYLYYKQVVIYYALILQAELLTKYKNKNLVLVGDGRCDSPGSSAKFCTYSAMEIESGKILQAETVDKREVDLQSPNMERKAFKRSMEFLLSHIKCTEIITDASSSIQKDF